MLSVSRMEPMLPEDRPDLENLATDLVAKANALAGRLNPERWFPRLYVPSAA